MNRDIPILMYHHVCPEPDAGRHFPYAVTPELFRQQMVWLSCRGYQTVHLSTLLRNPSVSGKKAVVITFDDGARNLLLHAVPVLRELQMTATFFVPSRLLGQWNCWDDQLDFPQEELMRPDEIRTLHGQGFEIGSHGARHLNMSKIPLAEAQLELQESKEDLESIIGTSVGVFAYPYGEFPPGYADMCRKAGYLGACAISSSARRVLDAPYALRRILIYGKDRGWRFAMKLNPFYLRLLARRDQNNPQVHGELHAA